ncbi:hypothetical protein BC834DRAFT_56853 [Gloeopeniophorella convolvens]|nr:hypothetical protein BC834DRAFT_56853 [Gloeopeniophorella convolvens]
MAGVPGFYASKAMTAAKVVLGSLSGPKGSNAMLPWKILQVIEHTADSTASLSRELRQQRSRACIRALYFIPGAVHDVLSALRNGSAQPTVSLLFSTDSWAIAGELSRHPDDGVALPARCVAAVIAHRRRSPIRCARRRCATTRAARDSRRAARRAGARPAGVPRRQRAEHPPRQPRQLRLAHRAPRAPHGGRAARVDGAQQRAILAERAALLRARMVWRWDGGSGGADPGELEGPRRRGGGAAHGVAAALARGQPRPAAADAGVPERRGLLRCAGARAARRAARRVAVRRGPAARRAAVRAERAQPGDGARRAAPAVRAAAWAWRVGGGRSRGCGSEGERGRGGARGGRVYCARVGLGTRAPAYGACDGGGGRLRVRGSRGARRAPTAFGGLCVIYPRSK